jgi:integrase
MPRAPRTIDAYRADWVDFEAWCGVRGVSAMPATSEVIAAYVDELATRRRSSTVQRRLAAIRAAHLDAGLGEPTDAPAVGAAMARAKWRQRHAATATTPVTVDALRAMSRALPDSAAGARDRAVILVGYGAALRPSELVGLRVDDLACTPAGLRLVTAQRRVTIPFGSAPELCAVAAWTRWIATTGLADGPAFRAVDRCDAVGREALGEKAIGRIIRRAATAAGLDPSRYTGLSLRRGMIGAAAENGASQRQIMVQTGHRSRRLVDTYIAATSGPVG